MSRRAPKYARLFEDDKPEPVKRRCDHPDCQQDGEYRAPKARDRLEEYYWFCLDHVRAYNQAWDYYANCKPEEIEAAIREDVTWGRPTWRLGHIKGGAPHIDPMRDYIRDPFGAFRERPGADDVGMERERRRSPAEMEAMAIMDLKWPLSAEIVKSRYRELCKRHHPDINGGDKESEERFKRIGQAYRTLMGSVSV